MYKNSSLRKVVFAVDEILSQVNEDITSRMEEKPIFRTLSEQCQSLQKQVKETENYESPINFLNFMLELPKELYTPAELAKLMQSKSYRFN